MRCPGCQHENPAGSNFCLGCGARLALACAVCGADLPAGARFCNKCGASVAVGPGGPARFASPRAYTPRHLAEKILTTKAALEGERKQVTVLSSPISRAPWSCSPTAIPKKRARFSIPSWKA